MIENTDQQLIAKYLSGEESSLNILVEKYFRRLYAYLFTLVNNKKDAEDLTQETFVKIWKSLKKFDQTKNFHAWIFTIAKNCAIDHLRKKRPMPFSELNEEKDALFIESLADAKPLASDEMEQLISNMRINKSLDKISLNQKSIISLYYLEELNFREIAEIMDESINTIKSRHRRALANLRQSLNESNT